MIDFGSGDAVEFCFVCYDLKHFEAQPAALYSPLKPGTEKTIEISKQCSDKFHLKIDTVCVCVCAY